MTKTSLEATDQIVIFRLDEQEFGLRVDQVREIIRLAAVTPMPHTAAAVAGMINVRGKVIPVVDMGEYLGLSPAKPGLTARIIIIEADGTMVGLRVDTATDVLRVPSDSLEPADEIVGQGGLTDITGVYKLDERLVALIDTSDLLEIGQNSDGTEKS